MYNKSTFGEKAFVGETQLNPTAGSRYCTFLSRLGLNQGKSLMVIVAQSRNFIGMRDATRC